VRLIIDGRGERMLEHDRVERTIARTRRGALPAPTRKAADFLPGDGKACDGCGDAITADETLYRVELAGIVKLRFHRECHVAWSTYER
jgi:hypothetical protein